MAQAGVYQATRSCAYEIRVRSQPADIGSRAIEEGRVTSIGNSVGGRNSAVRRMARNKAAEAALACFRAAKNSHSLPTACVPNQHPARNTGAMDSYTLKYLRGSAKKTLCAEVRRRGIRHPISKYSIYAVVTSPAGDRRQECGLGGEGKRYFGLGGGSELDCRGRPEQKWTPYMDLSASGMQQYVDDRCSMWRLTPHSEITRWQITNNGRRKGMISAYYRCFR